ncbi:coiled-coil domain-containing protein [Flavobacterium seoulense]|uniref:Peptidase S74 domain-containing protein n=1 Tax=Flavobacterium seoulense TaxID=1492738 RepID=A0A066WL24_9FLAO|nr:hypothetical protein [Flavobacterium seoulense]KDN54717.1 hypothetical protein FEM21_22310 [Flavobacterium seoulense]
MKRIILLLFAFIMQINIAQSIFPTDGENVGIGTLSPISKLTLNGSLTLNGGLTNTSLRPSVSASILVNGEIRGYSYSGNGADDGFLRLSAGGGTNSIKTFIDLSGYSTVPDMMGNIVFGTFGNERMRITSNGNIGIGTNNPEGLIDMKKTSTNAGGQAVLNLIGSTWAGDGASLVLNQLWNDRYYKTIIDNNGSNYGQTGSGLKIQTSYWNGSDVSKITALSLTPSGNLGIGKINPVNKLDVNGTIHSKEVKVDMTGWSDFVFKKEYTLPTLEEVEKQINEKGHLSNIPSEEEVLKNGINLGEMNAKLLQKIEELTLYVIEMKKQNDTMKKENESFKNKQKVLEKRIQKIENK